MSEKEIVGLVFCTGLLVVCAGVVGARVWVRRWVVGIWGVEDLFCGVAWVSYCGI